MVEAKKFESPYEDLTEEICTTFHGDWIVRGKFTRYRLTGKKAWTFNLAKFQKLRQGRGDARNEKVTQFINISPDFFPEVFGVKGVIERAYAEAKKQGLI